jgi:hypothetical protein
MAENFETVKISIFLNVTQIGLKTVFSQLTLLVTATQIDKLKIFLDIL